MLQAQDSIRVHAAHPGPATAICNELLLPHLAIGLEPYRQPASLCPVLAYALHLSKICTAGVAVHNSCLSAIHSSQQHRMPQARLTIGICATPAAQYTCRHSFKQQWMKLCLLASTHKSGTHIPQHDPSTGTRRHETTSRGSTGFAEGSTTSSRPPHLQQSTHQHEPRMDALQHQTQVTTERCWGIAAEAARAAQWAICFHHPASAGLHREANSSISRSSTSSRNCKRSPGSGTATDWWCPGSPCTVAALAVAT
jgi:hypothetical protein